MAGQSKVIYTIILFSYLATNDCKKKKNNYEKLYTVLSCLGVLPFVHVVF